MYEINFEIPAFLLSLLCFVYCITAKHRQYIPPKKLSQRFSSQHYVFLLMLLTNMLSSFSSVVGVYLTQASFSNVALWQYIFHALYFFFHTTLSVTFTLYIINVTGTSIKWKKIYYLLFATPYIISELIVLTNHWTKFAFYMDENLIYHRGPLMMVLYGIGAIYMIMGFVFFFKNKKAISKVDSMAVGFFIGIASLGIVIQALKSQYLVELFCESLACLVIMIVLEEKSGHIDPTTGLLNRMAFMDNNRRMMNSRQKYSMVLFRINEFEKLTQRFGNRETKALLIEVASYLNKETGVIDVYSYRKDAFAVIFKDGEYDQALEFTNNTFNRFKEDWEIDALKIKASIVYAIVKIPEDLSSLEELENIIYSDYRKNKPGSYFVNGSEIKSITETGKYEAALRSAISAGKLMVKYQPIWSVKEQKTVAVEALLRVDCDELRDLSPEVYIPIAEKTGLIREIGLFVFESVCQLLNSELIRNSSIQYVELNLSEYQFIYSDLVDQFEAIRNQYEIDAKKINLEVTESTATLDEYTVANTLKRFLNLGYTLSLDDFGTGYSNMMRMMVSSYVNIKVDKSLLWEMISANNEGYSNLIKFIKSLNFAVVQEGVETKEQLTLAINNGCDLIQGYYFSEPISDIELINYLAKESQNKDKL